MDEVASEMRIVANPVGHSCCVKIPYFNPGFGSDCLVVLVYVLYTLPPFPSPLLSFTVFSFPHIRKWHLELLCNNPHIYYLSYLPLALLNLFFFRVLFSVSWVEIDQITISCSIASTYV
jgi:hypothetical protein